MPKGKGENTKAVEAKQRKAAKVKDAHEKKQKDAYWADDDKQLAKKQSRKEEDEKKRLEKLARKNENKMMAEEELNTLAVKASTAAPAKITQAQINAEREKREAAARKAANAASKPKVTATPLVENLNRIEQPEDEATTIDEALKMLTTSDSPSTGDKHPERRMKAAYNEFEEIRLPQLKAENPTLRLTQLKQLLWGEWKKSPSNPMNQVN